MKGMVMMLAVALCAGCGHTAVNVNSSSAGSGTSSSSSVQVHADSGSRLVTLLGLTFVAATIVEMERGSPGWRRDDPPLAPDRVITEHDCRFPIESITGNLRCK